MFLPEGNEASAGEESFSGMLLEYPQYTRPATFHKQDVPAVLLEGDHEAIRRWRLERSMEITMRRRPDLLIPEKMSREERGIYERLREKFLEKSLAR